MRGMTGLVLLLEPDVAAAVGLAAVVDRDLLARLDGPKGDVGDNVVLVVVLVPGVGTPRVVVEAAVPEGDRTVLVVPLEAIAGESDLADRLGRHQQHRAVLDDVACLEPASGEDAATVHRRGPDKDPCSGRLRSEDHRVFHLPQSPSDVTRAFRPSSEWARPNSQQPAVR